jgi:hypothetical protein
MSTLPPALADHPKLPFDRQANENVLLFARRHPVFLAWQLTKLGIAGLVPFIAVIVIVGVAGGFGETWGTILELIAAAWLIFWAIKAYFAWYRYQNDIWVVTNQRVIDSVKKHWFHHQMASADLVDVEDISTRKEGVFPTMFNFGDLLLQTAGEQSKFVLSGIPEPSKVLALVDQTRDAAKRELRGLT